MITLYSLNIKLLFNIIFHRYFIYYFPLRGDILFLKNSYINTFSACYFFSPQGSAMGEFYLDDGHSFQYLHQKQFLHRKFSFCSDVLMNR